MKNSILVIIAATLTFALTGCGGGSGGSPTDTKPGALQQNINTVSSPTATGTDLYNANCATCHGSLATSAKKGVTLVRIQTAIANNIGGMGSLSALTTAQLQDVVNTIPPIEKPTMTLNSVGLVNNTYKLSTPGSIDVNYNVDYNVTFKSTATLSVVLSNSPQVDNVWYAGNVLGSQPSVPAQLLGDKVFTETTATNLQGTLTTFNSAAQYIIEPTPATGIDYTKPTYIVFTLYALDSSVPYVQGVPASYVISQKSVPITITP